MDQLTFKSLVTSKDITHTKKFENRRFSMIDISIIAVISIVLVSI